MPVFMFKAAVIIVAFGIFLRAAAFVGQGVGSVIYWIASSILAVTFWSDIDEEFHKALIPGVAVISNTLGTLVAAVAISIIMFNLWAHCFDLLGSKACHSLQFLWP
mgnify:CR=1 FL=1